MWFLLILLVVNYLFVCLIKFEQIPEHWVLLQSRRLQIIAYFYVTYSFRYKHVLTLIRRDFLKVVFLEGVNFWPRFPPSILFQAELIQYQYTFIEFLNRLFKVGSRLKKCWDHLLYTHAISLFATRNLSLENAVLEKRQREGQIDSLLRVNWRPVLIDIN